MLRHRDTKRNRAAYLRTSKKRVSWEIKIIVWWGQEKRKKKRKSQVLVKERENNYPHWTIGMCKECSLIFSILPGHVSNDYQNQ